MSKRAMLVLIIYLGITALACQVFAQVEPVGRIITIDTETQLIYLDVGKKDHIKAGDRFITFREDNPKVVTIVINEVIDDHISTGTLSSASAFTLKEGDMIVAGETAKNCLICHYNSEIRYQRESLHSTFFSISCLSCHGDHQSKEEGLLFSGQGKCEKCHSIKPVVTPGHQSFMDEGCNNCHQIHQTKNQETKDAEPTNFCADCHQLDSEKILSAHNNYFPESGKCYICHDPHNKHEGKYLYSEQHEPFKDGSCNSCHTEDSQIATLLKPVVSELCYDCHDEVSADNGKIHTPVLSGDCTACHSPHLSNRDKFLKKNSLKLCQSCHQKIFKGSFKHQPIVDGKCLSCHKPHQSKENKLLQKPLSELCGRCHKLANITPKKAHSPFTKKNCGACHNIHTSDYLHLFKNEPTKLCLKCHDKLDRTATERHQKMFDKPVPPGFPRNGYKLRLSNQGLITCYTCHEPHGATEDYLLREEPEFLCTLCHSAHWLKVFVERENDN